MNVRVVLRVLGLLIAATGAAMALPLIVSYGMGDEDWPSFGICLLTSLGLGSLLAWLFRGTREMRAKEGFMIVSLGWLVVAALGGLPFLLSGSVGSFTDAMFESLSGFTTTGASVLSDPASLPRGVALWRCQIQWLGGMGIVVLGLAILPILGVGGMQLFKAEAPGPSPDRLTPRIKETAQLLWGVYCMVSAAEMLALMFCGLDWYDALCHSFTTMATGGFSTKTASIGHFQSAAVDYVITVFMFLAGINFSLHYAFLRGRFKSYFRDDEFRIYLSVAVAATLVIMAINWRSSGYGWLENLRFSSFQSVSIMTTTGYVTADYEAWGSAAQYVLLSLMFVGGCAGSTGGGMKNVRLLLLSRHALIELRKLIHPRGVYFIRFNGRAVSQEVQTNILGFFLLLVITTLTATFAMTMLGLDLVSAFGSVAATLNNIGPGLGTVGPTDHFGHLPVMGKWILMFCMLLGRLELFTVLVLLTPDFWKRV